MTTASASRRYLESREEGNALVNTRMDELEWLRNQLEVEGNDLLREMVRSFAQGLMSAEADVVCGAPWGQQSPDRVNRRNGYRTRRSDTRVGSIELRIAELRCLLEPGHRPEMRILDQSVTNISLDHRPDQTPPASACSPDR